jgi:hypothetical protein
MTNPKTLEEKTPNIQDDSFSSWLEKTKIIAEEEGDLNNLVTDEKTNLVGAINETNDKIKKMLIKAIAMS